MDHLSLATPPVMVHIVGMVHLCLLPCNLKFAWDEIFVSKVFMKNNTVPAMYRHSSTKPMYLLCE